MAGRYVYKVKQKLKKSETREWRNKRLKRMEEEDWRIKITG